MSSVYAENAIYTPRVVRRINCNETTDEPEFSHLLNIA